MDQPTEIKQPIPGPADGGGITPPGPPTPPAPPPPPPPPAPIPPYSNGGVIKTNWINSVDWLQVGLVFVGTVALLSVIQYHRLKIKAHKTEIPEVKKKIADLEENVNALDTKKVDKKAASGPPKILGL